MGDRTRSGPNTTNLARRGTQRTAEPICRSSWCGKFMSSRITFQSNLTVKGSNWVNHSKGKAPNGTGPALNGH